MTQASVFGDGSYASIAEGAAQPERETTGHFCYRIMRWDFRPGCGRAFDRERTLGPWHVFSVWERRSR